MALPHPLDVHGGVPNPKGFNLDEFFYGCYADIADGPPANGSRGVAPEEDATTYITNRAAYALAENDEYLYDILSTQEIAVTEVGAIPLVIPTSSLVINPTGGAGAVSYTGTLYMGEAGWVDNQENRDTLFQLLDSNYNEVIVDGVEVKISAVAGSAIGDGFVSVATTLTLNKTIPAGSYRLAYGRGRTYETMPAYALIRADIRGLHEAPGESQKQAMYVLDASSSPTRPCDFSGPSALQTALSTIGDNAYLFLRAGTYLGPIGSNWTIANNNLTIIGEGCFDGTTDVEVQIDTTRDVILSGNGQRVDGVKFVPSAVAAGMDIQLMGTSIELHRCKAEGFRLYMDGASISVDDFELTPYATGVYIDAHVDRCTLRRVLVQAPTNSVSTDAGLYVYGSCDVDGFTFAATAVSCRGLHLLNPEVASIRNSTFGVDDGSALYVGAVAGPTTLESCTFSCNDGIAAEFAANCSGLHFSNCFFYSDQTLLDSGADPTVREMGVVFDSCEFKSTAGAVWYSAPAMRFLAEAIVDSVVVRSPSFNDCYFYDRRSKGVDVATNPPTAAVPTTWFNAFTFWGCRLSRCTLDRTSIGYMISDASTLRMAKCTVEDLHVVFGATSITPFQFDNGITANGILYFSDCSVKNLVVKGYFGGTWRSTLIYAISSGLEVSTIDGLSVLIDPAASNWKPLDTADHALVLRAQQDVAIRRFVWGYDNLIGDCSVAGGDTNRKNLVYLGTRSSLADSQFAFFEDSAMGIDDIVCAKGASAKVSKTRIYLKQYGAAGVPSPKYSAFIVGDVNLGVDGCTLSLAGITGSTGDPVAQSVFIEDAADGGCAKITNNHMVCTGNCGTYSPDFIILHNGAPDNSKATIIGNSMQAIAGATVPAVAFGTDALPAVLNTLNQIFFGATPAFTY